MVIADASGIVVEDLQIYAILDFGGRSHFAWYVFQDLSIVLDIVWKFNIGCWRIAVDS